MPRKRKGTFSGPRSNDGTWEYHTEHLLNHLNGERERLAQELEIVDQRIEAVSSLHGHAGRMGGGGGAGRRPAASGAREGTIAGSILGVLERFGNLSVPDIVEKTGLQRGQVYPSLMNLKKTNRIKTQSRGVYALSGAGGTVGGAPGKKGRGRGAGKPARPAGESSTAVMDLLRRRHKGLTKDEVVEATGMTRRQVHACLMTLGRSNQVWTTKTGIYKVRK